MNALISRVLAQKSRALRVFLLAFSAGALFYLGHPGHVGNVPVPLLTGLLYGLFITPAAVLTIAVLPALGALSDAVQWSRLAFASLVAAFPGALRPLAEAPLISATVVIGLASALVWLQTRRGRHTQAPAPGLLFP